MIDMTTWPVETLNVLDQVSLDPHNVRLEAAGAEIDADIIADLMANERVLDLVEGICAVGYLTHEVPIAIQVSDGKESHSSYIVVEGNRRLAALKVIQNPILAATARGKVEQLVAGLTNRDDLLSVDFKIAPNRDEADQLIAAIHTSNLRRPWTPARQAAFFETQLESGRSYSDLKVRYPTVSVERHVRYARLRNRILNAKLVKPELRQVVATAAWKRAHSTLTRIFDSKDFIRLTGVALDNTGSLTMAIKREQFDLVAEVILRGLEDGGLNTRTINTVESARFHQLVKEIEEAIASTEGGPDGAPGPEDEPEDPSGNPGGPAGRPSGPFAPGPSNPGGPSSPPAKPPRQKPTPRPRPSSYLPLENLHLPNTLPNATAALYVELSDVSVRTHPNLAHITLRAILEKSIKAYAEFKQVEIGKTKHVGQGGYVQLHNSMSWLEEYWTTNGPRTLVQPVKRLRSNRNITYTSTSDALNAANHNHQFLVDFEDVRAFWSSIEPILAELVRR